jgi:hypothetical protein
LAIYQWKSDLSCMFHVFNDLGLKAFREIFIFTQSFKNVDDFYPSIVKHHSRIKWKFCDFVLMDEFGPKDWLANGFEVMIYLFEDWWLSEDYDSVIWHNVKRQNDVVLLSLYVYFLFYRGLVVFNQIRIYCLSYPPSH